MQKAAPHPVVLHQVMSGELRLMLLPMVRQILLGTQDMDPTVTAVATVTPRKMVMSAPILVLAGVRLLIDYPQLRPHLVPAIGFR